MRPVDHILVHFGPEEPRVGVSFHEAVDFSLDLVEARWRRILQTLLGLLSGAVVDVHLRRRWEVKRYFKTKRELQSSSVHRVFILIRSLPHGVYHIKKLIGIVSLKSQQVGQLLVSIDVFRVNELMLSI